MSASKPAKKIPIVMYHSVTLGGGPFTISPKAFQHQMEFIKESYPVIRLRELETLLIDKTEDARKVVITFDDAYGNFVEFAYPVLKKLSLPCTVFVPTRFIDGRNEWDLVSNHGKFKAKRLMTASEIVRLFQEGLVDIGSHSVDHVSMRRLSRCEMEAQAADSKKTLEDLLQTKVVLFAYPYGQLRDFSEEASAAVQAAGYKLAVTSHWGTINSYRHRMQLRRIFFDETDSIGDLRDKLEGRYYWVAAKERVGYLLFGWQRGMNSKFHESGSHLPV